MSGRRPVAALDLSYDLPGGAYLGGSAAATATGSSGIEPLTLRLGLGYARRLDGATLDLGVTRSDYSRFTAGGRRTHYHEAYVGVIAGAIAARLYYSPDYFRPGLHTLYAEINVGHRLARDWQLSGHVGTIEQLAGPVQGPRRQYDWSAGVGRSIGGLEAALALTGGGPGRDLTGGRARARTSLVARLSRSF